MPGTVVGPADFLRCFIKLEPIVKDGFFYEGINLRKSELVSHQSNAEGVDKLLENTSLKERLLTGEQLISKTAVWLLSFLVLYLLAGEYYLVINREIYPGVHLVMEFISVVVAVCASLMSWYGYRYRQELRMMIFALTFCVVAVIDFAHSLSYLGMPGFITPNSVNKASTYWIAGRLVLGAGLLAAVLAGNKVKMISRPSLFLFSFVLAGLAVIAAVALYLPLLPPMYDAGAGRQTGLKILLEYLVMAALGVAALRLLLKREVDKQDFYLFLALIITILSEMAFTLYHHAYDTYNLLGHIYKVIAFVFIFKSLLDEAVAILYETNRTLERQREMLAETNRQLKEMDRLKDEFLANTNHEMRTPLSAIIAFTELMLDESTGKLSDLQKDYLNEINDSGKELLGKINGFLDLSKIAAGKAVLHKENFELDELIEDVSRRVNPLFIQKGVVLEHARSPDRPSVLADREKIGQVLTNLLSNALKFTPPGGRVLLTAGVGESGREIFISVKDSGIGIAPGDQEKIFEPFLQVDGTIVRKYGGTGIGLTLSKKLVELHGGAIEVCSECNKGSVFTFKLPVQN